MSSVQAVRRPSPFSVLGRRDFGLMWLGELVSTIGSSFTAIAAGILVYRQTGSALAVGMILAATVVPSLLVGLVAGVVVDRFDRKRILVASDLVRAILIAAIPFAAAVSILWLYVLVFVASTVQQFFDPAKESVIPELAPDDELESANALLAISSFGSTAVGFGAAGILAATDINLAFYIDAVSFLLSAICIMLVRIAPHDPAAPGAAGDAIGLRTINANLREGLAFLIGSPVLRALLVVGAVYSLGVGLWNSLLLPFSLTALQATEFEYGLQEGLTSVGFVIGSLVVASYASRLYEGQWIVISLLGSALCGFAYALSTNVWVAIGFVALSGCLNAPYGIGRRTLIQRNTTRAVRGRVASAYFVASSALFLPGMLAAGLADVVDIRLLMGLVAALWLGAGALGLVLPGLARPAADWRRALMLLRTAPVAPVLSAGRPATLADFDRLAGRLPLLARLEAAERAAFLAGSTVRDAGAGTAIVRVGEQSDAAYFVLEGSLVAGTPSEDGEDRILSRMNPGDFFGEIAALTGMPRTANVLAQEPSELLEVTAETLQALVADPAIATLVRSTMTERLARTGIADLPRFIGVDHAASRELRRPVRDPRAGSSGAGAPEAV